MSAVSGARRLGPLLVAALIVRLVPVFVSARETVDVARYHKVAEHVLDVSWNPYQAPRLYPYPPLWVWFEAGAGALERHGASFPIVIKLPIVAADVAIVALLAAFSRRAGWIYALHPVSVLVTGFHGQFDALMLLFVMLALSWHGSRSYDASALALAAAIGTKSFPVLLLPFFLLATPGGHRARLRYAALATVPVALALLPYAIDDAAAVRRELLGYSGIADFGWIGVVRGGRYLVEGRLLKSRPQEWGLLVPAAKVLFLAGYAALLGAQARGRLKLSLEEAALAVYLVFLVFYGAISAQYLLWPVPLGARRNGAGFLAYTAAATAALGGFYAFLAPGIFFADEVARPTGALWALGSAAVLVASALWLVATVRHGMADAETAPPRDGA
jgi:hypothetical protein